MLGAAALRDPDVIAYLHRALLSPPVEGRMVGEQGQRGNAELRDRPGRSALGSR
jgi:hypothetical protein